MKKALSVVLVLATMLAFASCVSEAPEEESSSEIGEGSSAFETESKTKEDSMTEETVTEGNKTESAESETIKNEEEEIVILPEDGAKIILANDEVYGWWSSYNYGKTDSNPFYRHEDIYYPKAVIFSWGDKASAAYYRFYISTDESFALDKTESYLVNSNSLTLSHLYTGTKYYWFVVSTEIGEGGEEINTQAVSTRSFTTAESPRCLEIEGVSNTRDIGGIAAANGYRIKQGMIYRGGKLENITEEGKDFFRNYLNLKTDLDLRTPGEGGAGSGSPLGEDINYVNIDGRYYTGSKGITTEEGKAIFADEIRLFTNPDNYPIYIHCSLGRDRTGTLVFVIESLLGVKKNMLVMDYELSVFSVTGTLDNASISAIKNNILATYDYISSYEGSSFAEKTENYLLSIGITAEEIQTIRDLLLEEVE